MSQRKQDDIARTLILCGSVPFGIIALVALLDGVSWTIGALMGVMR